MWSLSTLWNTDARDAWFRFIAEWMTARGGAIARNDGATVKLQWTGRTAKESMMTDFLMTDFVGMRGRPRPKIVTVVFVSVGFLHT